MKITEVNKGRMVLSNDPDENLRAQSLGCCLALCVHDPATKISAMGVVVLPKVPEGADHVDLPLMEPVGGLSQLFKELLAAGARKEDMKVSLVGAARFLSEPQEIDFGVQLYKLVRKILAKNGIQIVSEHVGGPFNRTVEMNVGTGEVKLVLGGIKEVKL